VVYLWSVLRADNRRLRHRLRPPCRSKSPARQPMPLTGCGMPMARRGCYYRRLPLGPPPPRNPHEPWPVMLPTAHVRVLVLVFMTATPLM
jgi:hypothetical protein